MSALAPRAFPDTPRECGVPTPPCSALRLLSSPAHSRACPFAVGRATQVYRRKRNQPGINQRAIALAWSDHPTATGESAPSVTLPPTSPHVIVWCGDTPVVHRPLDDRCERHKRAPRLGSLVSHEARRSSEECVGSHDAVARIERSQLRIATIRHGLNESFRSHFPLFWSFWLAISEPGWTSRKKVPLGIRLKPTRPSHGRVCCSLNPPEAR